MISELTRRDLRDLLGGSWSGRLSALEFLSRLYELDTLPSSDRRYSSMSQDVAQHTPPGNDDWGPVWVFSDGRLGLGDDQSLLRFVAASVHPVVVDSHLDVDARVRDINNILLPDGFELTASGAVSGRPVFSARVTTPRRVPTGAFTGS